MSNGDYFRVPVRFIALLACVAPFCMEPLFAGGSPLLSAVTPQLGYDYSPTEKMGRTSMERVQSLDLSQCGFDDLSWIKDCPNLKCVKLGPRSDGAAYGIEAFEAIASCKTLRHLSVEFTAGVTTNALAVLFDLPEIESLSLAWATSDTHRNLAVDGAELVKMGKAWPGLKALDLSGATLSGIAQDVTFGLVHLRLRECRIDDSSLTHLLSLKLAEIDLRGVELNESHYARLASMKTLRVLGIERRRSIDIEALSTLFSNDSLGVLSLAEIDNLSDQHIKAVAKSSAIQALDISMVTPLDADTLKPCPVPESFTVTPASFAQLSQMSSLTTLVARTFSLGNEELIALGQSKSLRELDIRYAECWTAVGIAALRNVEIEKLDVSGGYWETSASPVNDEVLKNIGELKHLRILKISHSKLVTKDAIRILGKVENLEDLDLSWSEWVDDGVVQALGALSKLQKLDMSNCEHITSQGVATVSAIRTLKELSLSGCKKIGSDALVSIAALPALQMVDLSGTAVLQGKGFRAFWDKMTNRGVMVYPNYYL